MDKPVEIRTRYNPDTGQLPEDVPQVDGLMRENVPRPESWPARRARARRRVSVSGPRPAATPQ